jgi:hypothetical protein
LINFIIDLNFLPYKIFHLFIFDQYISLNFLILTILKEFFNNNFLHLYIYFNFQSFFYLNKSIIYFYHYFIHNNCFICYFINLNYGCFVSYLYLNFEYYKEYFCHLIHNFNFIIILVKYYTFTKKIIDRKFLYCILLHIPYCFFTIYFFKYFKINRLFQLYLYYFIYYLILKFNLAFNFRYFYLNGKVFF